jgi:CheY-like chemotaxis protein
VQLKITISKDVPSHIHTDENRLKQILVGLVSRALKCTSKGTIKIDMIQDPEQNNSLQISVTDTGIVTKDQDKGNTIGCSGKGEEIGAHKNEIGLGIANFADIVALLNDKGYVKGIEFTNKAGVGSKYWFRILKDQNERSSLEDLKNVKHGENTLKLKKSQSEKVEFYHQEEDDQEGGIAGEFEEGPIIPASLKFKLAGHMSLQGKSKKDLECSSKVNTCPNLTRENSLKSSQSETEILPKSSNVQKPRLDKFKSSSQTTIKNNPKSVLIVDDNPFNLLIATNYIEELGYFVQTAFSGKEAIEKAKKSKKEGHNMKFILMDCQMPVMDGYETAQALNDLMKKKEIQKVPILAWTVLDSGKDVNRCYKSGMAGYLPKPSSQDALLEALSVFDPALAK